MSTMRSASSSTTISMSPSDTASRSTRSMRRPGVAMTTSMPSRSAEIWRSMRAPPYTDVTRRSTATASGSSTSVTWRASSRVGTSTRARGRWGAARRDAGEDREAEGERLARAGLGLAAHVSPGDAVGDREGLDGKGRR